MRYVVLKPIRISGMGLIRPGREVELPDVLANLYLPGGAIEAVRVRELRENPVQPVGEPLSASPAGLASQQTIVKPYDSGDLETKPEPRVVTEAKPKKRGRPKKQ